MVFVIKISEAFIGYLIHSDHFDAATQRREKLESLRLSSSRYFMVVHQGAVRDTDNQTLTTITNK